MTVKAQKKNNMAFKLKSGNKPPFKILGSTPNIKEGLDRKYGLGDYATGGTKQRMLPGESEYQYNVRMRNARSKAKSNMIDENKDEISDLIQPNSITNPAPKGQETVYTNIPVNKDDLRKNVELPNFGISDIMSFGEAFKQAGKASAKKGDIFEWRGNKFLYEFK